MKAAFQKNFGLLMLSNLLTPVFSMVLVLAIAKLQGAEALGRYSVVMTVFVFGQSCAALGLPIVITREVAQRPHDAGKYLNSACALTTLLLVAVLAVALPLMYALVAERAMFWATAAVLVSLVPSTINFYGEAVLLAFERAVDFVQVNLSENILRTVVGSLLVWTGHGIVAIAAAILILRLFAAVALLVVLRRHRVRLSTGVDRDLCASLLRDVPVTGAIPLVNAVYTRADIFLLTWFGTWADVGIYSAAVRLVDVARTIPLAYSRALYPVLSRVRGSAEAFAREGNESLRNLLLIMTPLAALMSALATAIVSILYGSKLAGAGASLAVLSWSLVPLAIAAVLAQMLFATGKQHIDLRVNVIMTAVSVAVNLVAIPRWGAVGAAATAVAATTLYAGLQYLWVEQNVIALASTEQLGKIGLAGVLSAAVTVLVASKIGPIPAGVVGVGCYMLGVLMMRLVTPQEWHRMRELITRSERA